MSNTTAISFLKLLRPHQWLKNLMLYFPPFLGGAILTSGVIARGIIPFCAFCLGSSATYVLNDILDAANDAHHEAKKLRPIPSGKVSRRAATVLGGGLVVCAIALAAGVSRYFLLLLLFYLGVSAVYSLKLKEYAIVDLFCIAAGFLLRLEAGGEVFGIAISEWLFLSVFLLAIFLSTGKRLGEKNALGAASEHHRKSLKHYPDGFLDGIMYMTGGSVLVTYTMYVITRHSLIYTVPLCAFGLMRFMLLVKSGSFGDPTESLVKDRVLFMVGFLWAVMVGLGIYLKVIL